MENNKKIPRIALGAWSWGAGAAGGDQRGFQVIL